MAFATSSVLKVEKQSSDSNGNDVTCLYYEEGPLQQPQVVVYWSWEAYSDSEWLPSPHHKPFSADFFCVMVIVVHCDLEITFFDAQTCSMRRYRMSLGLWAAHSLALDHILRHTSNWSCVSPLREWPPTFETFGQLTVRAFSVNLVVLLSSG